MPKDTTDGKISTLSPHRSTVPLPEQCIILPHMLFLATIYFRESAFQWTFWEAVEGQRFKSHGRGWNVGCQKSSVGYKPLSKLIWEDRKSKTTLPSFQRSKSKCSIIYANHKKYCQSTRLKILPVWKPSVQDALDGNMSLLDGNKSLLKYHFLSS